MNWIVFGVSFLVGALVTSLVFILITYVFGTSTTTTGGLSGTAANIILSVENQADVAALANKKWVEKVGEHITPSYLGIKLIAAYIVENVDPITQNNVGTITMFYTNPQCLGDLSKCGVNPETDEILVEDYFDFSQDSAAVNTALGAQASEVTPGTYRYVRLEFCKEGTGGNPNIAFKAADMASNHGFPVSMCTVNAELDPPLVIVAGDTVEISLAYDITGSVLVQASNVGSNDYCTDTSPSYCLTVPTFTPAAIKV